MKESKIESLINKRLTHYLPKIKIVIEKPAEIGIVPIVVDTEIKQEPPPPKVKKVRPRVYKKLPYKEYAMKKYNITEEVFDSLPDYCEICGSTTGLCIDHCHNTGRVRGRLCSKCNTGISMLQENPIIIDSAKEYIIKRCLVNTSS